MDVVDAQLRVRGVRGAAGGGRLRHARIISGNTNAPR